MFGGSFNDRSTNDDEKDKLRDRHSCISLRWPWHEVICKTEGQIYRHLCLDVTWRRFWVSLTEKDNVSVNKATVSEIPTKSTLHTHTHTHALVERRSRQITQTETYHWIRERWAKQMRSERVSYITVSITGDMKRSMTFSVLSVTANIAHAFKMNITARRLFVH